MIAAFLGDSLFYLIDGKGSISSMINATKHQPKERILIVSTSPQKALQFNRSIHVSFDGGALSSDKGQLIYREFDEKLVFSQTIAEHLQLNDPRTYSVYSNAFLIRQKIYQLIAGYEADDAADHLTHDPVFTHVLGQPLASQPSLSRCFHRFDEQAIVQLQDANQALLDKAHRFRQEEGACS